MGKYDGRVAGWRREDVAFLKIHLGPSGFGIEVKEVGDDR
jgi:hypothetical protein